MTTPTPITPEQEIVLQSFLIRQAEMWLQYQKEVSFPTIPRL